MIYALTVTRDEAGRYLERMIESVKGSVDEHFVYDDRSVDATVDICLASGCQVGARPPSAPSFAESEGAFRQQAWDAFEQAINPAFGDWIFSVDADELLCCDIAHHAGLRAVASAAADGGFLGVNVPIREVWTFAPDERPGGWGPRPMVRVDNFWATIKAPRLFPYAPNGVFRQVDIASGSAPTYVTAPFYEQADVVLAHLGYAEYADRCAKYDRYRGRPGHNPSHIASILSQPTLIGWSGPTPQGGWA